jgi:DNA-binding transcriptional LysR family regulator
VLDDYLNSTRQFRILWPSSRQLSPKVKVFVAFMAEHLFPPEERG